MDIHRQVEIVQELVMDNVIEYGYNSSAHKVFAGIMAKECINEWTNAYENLKPLLCVSFKGKL